MKPIVSTGGRWLASQIVMRVILDSCKRDGVNVAGCVVRCGCLGVRAVVGLPCCAPQDDQPAPRCDHHHGGLGSFLYNIEQHQAICYR